MRAWLHQGEDIAPLDSTKLDTLCHENDDEPGADWGATMNIGGWLRDLGLERYEPLFIENAIYSDVLAELTEGDLEKLGIPLGDRNAHRPLSGPL